MINLAKREGVMNPDSPELVSTAEAATLQLEFRYLSWLTGNEEYWEKAEKVKYINLLLGSDNPLLKQRGEKLLETFDDSE